MPAPEGRASNKGAIVKRYIPLFIILFSIALLTCCDGDPADPVNGDDDPVSPYSGTFFIESTLVSNTCLVPAAPPAMMSVVVDGDSIVFGGFPGEWNEVTSTGTGNTPEYTIPVLPPDCYAYYTVVYEITYVNADSFSGTYGANYRKDPECPNPDPCSFLYNITGSR